MGIKQRLRSNKYELIVLINMQAMKNINTNILFLIIQNILFKTVGLRIRILFNRLKLFLISFKCQKL